MRKKLTITNALNGGYVVTSEDYSSGSYPELLFAATTLDECCNFIKEYFILFTSKKK